MWISGASHVFGYVDVDHRLVRPAEFFLVGNALIWQRGEVTLRLEGKLSRGEAVRIARSFK